MTPREIVRRTLEFGGPARVARSFDGSDFKGAGCKARTRATDWQALGDGRWQRTDEWGNTWSRIDPTSKGEVVRGVLENLSDLDGYTFPDYTHAEDYAEVVQLRVEHGDHWLIGHMPGFAFNIARKMRKLDQYLMDLVTEPDWISTLHDRIDVMLADMIRNFAGAGADSVMFPEDWGTQTQTLISPELWHQEFQPRFATLCGLAHDLGLRVFMHSCGQIRAIVPGLIDAGIDVLQFDQPDLHGIDTLAAYQQDSRITFWCPVDIQQVLPRGDERVIRDKARQMLDELWRGRGGFIAGYYGDNVSIGIDPAWQDSACDEFVCSGVRSRYKTDET